MKKPKFNRQHASKKRGKVQKSWRKPKGIDSKQKKGEKASGRRPKIGYRTKKAIRGLHPTGYKEVIVRNVSELEKIDSKTYVIRISATVGKKKRALIIKKANEMKLKVLGSG